MWKLLRNRTLMLAAAIVLAIPAVSPAAEPVRPDPQTQENDFRRPASTEIQKEVAGINTAIKARGAKWIAGETSMTRLSPAERKMRLGILAAPPPGEIKVYSPTAPSLSASGAATATASAAPGTLDWRSYNGGDFVTPVRDQGNCGDCWAFGSVAGLESKTLITQNTPGVNLDLSEQVVNSCDSADNYGNGCNGGNLVTSFFVNTGVPLESCYPYTATDGNCSNACANWRQNTYKTTSYSWIVPYGSQQTVDALKAGLYVYGPLVVTFSVYNDFYSYTSGIYTHTSGSFQGYHAVLLVGYDDTNNCFIVKNSWGTGWGESGFFEIAYSEVNGDCQFGYEALAYGDQTSHNIISCITNPVNGGAISGTSCTITGQAWAATGFSLTKVEVSTDGGATWHTASGTGSWSYTWSPLPADGVYTIKSRATDNGGNIETPGSGVTTTIDTPPSSVISAPANNATLTGTTYTIKGTATSNGSGVQSVYISTDGGNTWHLATGTTNWSYLWTMPPYGGKRTIKSRATDNVGNVETPGAGVTVTVTPYGKPELPHYNWNPAMIPNGTDCAFCHTTPGTFLAQDFLQSPVFCYSCHNAAGNAHALDIFSTIGQHPMFVNATALGRKRPTYGNITLGEYNDIPGSRLENGYLVTCMTCHNSMRKSDDPGRVWEYTSTSDQYKYYLQNGGWSGYGNLTPKVYRDTSLWSGPTYSQTKKGYLVNPSEYTYNETSGFIRFKTQQSSFSYIYVTLYYPYLRAPMQDNSLCSDCHTEATHEGANCYNCHAAHNTSNIEGIRQNVRTLDYTTMPVKFLRYTGSNSFANGTGVHTGICVVCHTTTKYYRRDGTGFVNHSGGYNYNGKDCTICHTHASGFAKYSQ